MEYEKLEPVVVDQIKELIEESGVEGEVMMVDVQKEEVMVIPPEELNP